MSKALRNNYLLLLVTGATLAIGLGARFAELELLSLVSFAVGAAVGFVLSIALLVSAIRHGEFGSDILALISIIATVLTNELLAASVIALMLAGGRALSLPAGAVGMAKVVSAVTGACLLTRTDLPVTHIALEVGFYDHSDFARQFRRHVGQTASAYRLERK